MDINEFIRNSGFSISYSLRDNTGLGFFLRGLKNLKFKLTDDTGIFFGIIRKLCRSSNDDRSGINSEGCIPEAAYSGALLHEIIEKEEIEEEEPWLKFWKRKVKKTRRKVREVPSMMSAFTKNGLEEPAFSVSYDALSGVDPAGRPGAGMAFLMIVSEESLDWLAKEAAKDPNILAVIFKSVFPEHFFVQNENWWNTPLRNGKIIVQFTKAPMRMGNFVDDLGDAKVVKYKVAQLLTKKQQELTGVKC